MPLCFYLRDNGQKQDQRLNFAEKPQVLLGSSNKSSNLPVVALWRRTCLASCTLVAAARRKKVLLSHGGHEVGRSSLPMNSPKILSQFCMVSFHLSTNGIAHFFLTPLQVIQIVQRSATTAKFFDLSFPPHQLDTVISPKSGGRRGFRIVPRPTKSWTRRRVNWRPRWIIPNQFLDMDET